MNIYQPYFYIIKNISTGIMYAGSKYGQNAKPSLLLKTNGYTTSSKIINNIINTSGIESFEILRIDTFCDNMHPYDYETVFLNTHNCASSPEWYNQHNNDKLLAFGTEKFSQYMISIYGCHNAAQSVIIKDKISITLKNRYGARYNKEKWSQTMQSKYGVLHNSKIPGFGDKVKQTKLEKYGATNYVNTDKAAITKFATYGDSRFNNREAAYNTNLSKYGVQHISQCEFFRLQVYNTNMLKFVKKFGVNSYEELLELIIYLIDTYSLSRPSGKINFRKLAQHFPLYGDEKCCMIALRKFYYKFKD